MEDIFGMKVITSPYCYVTKEKVKGIPSRHKPNTRRPLFRKVMVKTPMAYMIGGNNRSMVIPPEWAESMRQHVDSQVRMMEAEAFNLAFDPNDKRGTAAAEPAPLTFEAMESMVKELEKVKPDWGPSPLESVFNLMNRQPVIMPEKTGEDRWTYHFQSLPPGIKTYHGPEFT
jgi:hypothetical protein